MFQSHTKWTEDRMSVFYGYGKGGPARRRRKDDPDENNLPPSYDLDKLDVYRKLKMPGGLLHAMTRAGINKSHVMRGTIWSFHIWTITPGMWVHVDGELDVEWALVFSTELSRLVLVNRRGEYFQVKKADAPGVILDVAEEPPWLEDWLKDEGVIEDDRVPEKPAKRPGTSKRR